MSLPIPVVISVFQALIQAHNESENHQREIQLKAHVANLQHSYDIARLQAEKEIIQNIISLTKHKFDRKMDFITDAYNQVQNLIIHFRKNGRFDRFVKHFISFATEPNQAF